MPGNEHPPSPSRLGLRTIIVGSFVVVAVVGLPLFQRITAGRLRLTEVMNNDIIFFASAISVFDSLTVGLIAVGV